MTDLPILILLLLLIALLFRVDFVFYIVYLTVGIYLWSIWYTPRALRWLTVKRRYSSHAYLGESTTITLTIENRSRLPIPWLQLDESVPVQLQYGSRLSQAFRLSGRSSKTFTYKVRSMRRGYYQLGPAQVTIGDLFGFKESRLRIMADFLTVYPKIIPISRFGTRAKLPFGTVRCQQRLFQDPSRPVGVREFRNGDAIKHLNWKASAHAGSLLVKAYQPSMLLESMIFLNLNISDYSSRMRIDGPEWAIVVAASLAAYLVDNRQSVGLTTNGADPLAIQRGIQEGHPVFDESSGRLTMGLNEEIGAGEIATVTRSDVPIPRPIPPNNGRTQLMAILESLARLEPAKSSTLASWSTTASTGLNWGITLLIISPAADLDACRAIHGLARRGFNPTLVIIEPYTDFQAILKRSRPFGIPAVHISTERDLRLWLLPSSSPMPASPALIRR